MYNLGESFKVDTTKGVATNSKIFKGNKYRITILTDGLIRLEYDENGNFNDKLTELVVNRIFKPVEVQYKEDPKYLYVYTKNCKISYIKDRPFEASKLSPASNLSIELVGSEKNWYYNHPEARNIGTPISNQENSTKLKLKKGLYSYDGFVSLDDSKSNLLNEDGTYIIRNKTDKSIDIYVFMYGNDFESCLKDYFELTGFPPLLPRFALGNWWSKNKKYNEDEVRSLIDSFKYNDIPLSILMLERDWEVKPNIKKDLDTGFTFNNELFKEPETLIKYLHDSGVRVGIKINPYLGFYDTDKYYNQAITYLKPDSKGVIPFNVLDPKTIDVYLKLFIHPLDATGIDFYNIDFKDDYTNYDILRNYHLCDMARNKLRRPFGFGYSTAKVPHRYSVLYDGPSLVEWESLRTLPYFTSMAMNNGVVWWSHDIGGYYKGVEEDELYIRFVQYGTFAPILRLSSDESKYYKREPWLWPMRTFSIVKEYLQLRHKLIPYLYSEAYKYTNNGSLYIKPVFYKYPELFDDEWYRNEYFLGTELFIAPIITTKDDVMNRSVHKFFIPDGTWYDFFTGKKFVGPNSFVSFFRDQDYPVYAKAGSIITMGHNDNLNDITPPKNMEIHIFPGVNNSYTLYEDDGVSSLYKEGFYLKTQIDYNYMPNNYTVIIRACEGKSGIVPEYRNYKIVFRNTKKADEVIVFFNNAELKDYTCYNSGPDFVVELKDVLTVGQLTLNCKGKDIEIDAIRLINKDIGDILSDLQIKTVLKDKIDTILFDKDMPIKKKRIEIRKLRNKGLEKKFMDLFLDLLEYVEQV